MIKCDSNEQFYATLSTNKLVLADFYADWCAPCKWLDPILDNLEKSIPESCSIIKVDIEKLTDLATEFHIKSVPVLIVFKNGFEVWRLNGFLFEDELRKVLFDFSRETTA